MWKLIDLLQGIWYIIGTPTRVLRKIMNPQAPAPQHHDDDELMDEDESDEEYEYVSSDLTSSYDSDSDASDDEEKWSRRLALGLRNAMDKRFQSEPQPLYLFKPFRLDKRSFKTRISCGDFPLPRSGHRVIASESHLYSLGGFNPRNALNAARRGECLLFQELWCYNFATGVWKLLLNTENATNMPKEMASNALVIHNNVLISHGGTGYPFGETCSNDCYVYTTSGKPFLTRLKVTGDLPTAQYGPCIVIHENYLYTIGGTTGFEYTCDVYRLNLLTKIWENVYICRPEMRDDPEGRYRHEVAYDGEHIYVLGGGTSSFVYDMQRIPAFNLKNNCWDYINTLPDRTVFTTLETADAGFPKARKCFSCVQNKASNGDVEVFITGGLQCDFTTYFSDIWRLNLHTKQWTLIKNISFAKPLYFHSAAHADNGCMYIFGGIEYSSKDMRRRNDLYKMWMTIPKLSEMCWDAITYYNKQLHLNGHAALLKAGIPQRFVQRLPIVRTRKQIREQQIPSEEAAVNLKRPRSRSQ